MLLPHKNAQKNASIMYKGLAARWKPYEVVRERIWNRCNNLLWRNTEQRMGCFRGYTWYRTENPVLIPSAIFKQSSGSKFGWPSSFASYAKICHNCPLGFVIVFRLKKLRPRGPLWSLWKLWKLYFRTAIKFTYSLALTWKVENEGGSFVR